jgi:hypothetical protein
MERRKCSMGVDSVEELATVLHSLIAYFVERQRLVGLALLELRPRFVSFGGQDKFLGIDVAPYLEAYYERESRASQKGIWKKDWEHWIHGMGCRLTHLQTGEPIEWDAPNLRELDLGWFDNHLRWRLEKEPHDPSIKRYAQLSPPKLMVNQAINILVDRQVILFRQSHRCLLLEEQGSFLEHEIIPQHVVEAVLSLVENYRVRRDIAIEAMVSLRPDIILYKANERSDKPDVAAHLKRLCEGREQEFKGWSIVKGQWGEWNYEIRYYTITLKHQTTGETLLWRSIDPQFIDFGSFQIHLNWRFIHETEDTDVNICLAWVKDYLNGKSLTFSQSLYDITGVSRLMGNLIDQRAITLKLDGDDTIITYR